MKTKRHQTRLDRVGITASTLCALHCAVVPLFFTFLPLAGLGFLTNPLFEWGMIAFALLLGVSSIFLAYLRTHRKVLPLVLLITGFAIVLLGHIFVHGVAEAIIVPIGGLTIAFAHFVNYKYAGNCTTETHVLHFKPGRAQTHQHD